MGILYFEKGIPFGVGFHEFLVFPVSLTSTCCAAVVLCSQQFC